MVRLLAGLCQRKSLFSIPVFLIHYRAKALVSLKLQQPLGAEAGWQLGDWPLSASGHDQATCREASGWPQVWWHLSQLSKGYTIKAKIEFRRMLIKRRCLTEKQHNPAARGYVRNPLAGGTEWSDTSSFLLWRLWRHFSACWDCLQGSILLPSLTVVY